MITLVSLTEWLSKLGIPPVILLLLVVVVVAPFVLPPVKDWKTASLQQRVSVSIYFLGVVIVLIYFIRFL